MDQIMYKIVRKKELNDSSIAARDTPAPNQISPFEKTEVLFLFILCTLLRLQMHGSWDHFLFQGQAWRQVRRKCNFWHT